MKKVDKSMLITSLVCLLPLVLSSAMYNRLPDRIAVHWDSAGNADNFASKGFAAFGLPLFLLALNIFVHFMLNNDPKKMRTSKAMRQISKWLIPVISVILMPITLFIAVGVDIPIPMITSAIVGIILILCGNYLPKSRQNYTVGIKLPWTLNSEENWNKTHRLAGYLWVLGGIIIIGTSFINAKLSSFSVVLIVVSILVVIPMAYSYRLYRKGV